MTTLLTCHLDLIIAKQSGYPEMVFNHFAHAHPMIPEIGVFDSGENFDGMALVLRLFEHHLDYQDRPSVLGYLPAVLAPAA